jgi:TetR/AcrR family transcriptional regulator, transcriptional repressor for nem operon
MARPREFEEREVLRAARDQFWSSGYAGTSVDELLAATKLGKGSLYGAFGNKYALFIRVFDDYCTEVIDDVRRALEGPDTKAYRRLRAHVLGVAEGTAADSRRLGCFLGKGTAELASNDPVVASRALRAFEDYEDLLLACVEQAQRHGDIDPSANPRQLAGLLLAVLRGIDALGKAGKTASSLNTVAEAALRAIPRP